MRTFSPWFSHGPLTNVENTPVESDWATSDLEKGLFLFAQICRHWSEALVNEDFHCTVCCDMHGTVGGDSVWGQLSVGWCVTLMTSGGGYGVISYPDSRSRFMDVLDAQWECEGELIPLDSSVLHPTEFVVYQHGLHLLETLCQLNLVGHQSLLQLVVFSFF